MDVTPSTLAAMTIGFHNDYQAGYQTVPPSWMAYATLIKSTTKQEKYPFMGMVPRMRTWLGDRILKNLQAYDYTITNAKYESSVEVPREDIEDDRIGLWSPAVQQLGQNAALWYDDTTVAALIAGTSSTCYDGQNFFNGSHPVDPYNSGAGTQSNLFTTTALTEANYATVRANMMKLKDENGKRLRIFPDTMLVAPSLEKTARTIVQAAFLSQASGSTQSNVYQDTVKVVVIPGLEDDTAGAWYLVDTSKPVKPLIMQERIAPEFQALADLQSEHVIKRDTFIWGARARGGAGYSLWQLIAKATP